MVVFVGKGVIKGFADADSDQFFCRTKRNQIANLSCDLLRKFLFGLGRLNGDGGLQKNTSINPCCQAERGIRRKGDSNGIQMLFVDFKQCTLSTVSAGGVAGLHDELLFQKLFNNIAYAGRAVVCQLNELCSADGTEMVDDIENHLGAVKIAIVGHMAPPNEKMWLVL